MFYEVLFRGLHDAHVRYLVVGAVAINLHGVPRMTADLDLMVELADANLRKFVDTLGALGYRPRVPVAAAEFIDPDNTLIHPARPYEEVDVFLDNPIEFASAYARRVDMPVQDFAIPLTSVPDLIAMKRMTGREQDRSDIDALMRLSRLDQGEQA